ncbi:glycosyltransferase family 2 protein [Halorubrum sp. CGM4_25_10-8A]|uniref:glycosyltransferase family 2 protein n=1 Tax=Halorubrum sp. CGM4_25_10-8A TaxID=2518116 RepID=UPI0010F761EF|nr:glycosyltransferase family 2 protein [Halorubrum sp. CGM4_25_10-8A]TKX40348.1 glycosyltransferase family 2 protein [Halorubrum sp. CGM4_25_10-8A]
MKFSIISVYNDREVLSEYLLDGIDKQTYSKYETVLINNEKQQYDSASDALNEGARRASGEYLVFIHQDVKLPKSYLSKAVSYLSDIDDLGIAGAAGVRETGKYSAEGVNTIHHGPDHCEWERGTPISEPTEVETLDELLLIIHRDVFDKYKFSPSLCPGWHLYGVEYSMRMKRIGRSVKVLPLDLWHRSDGGWRGWHHDRTLLRLVRHYTEVDCIHTTGGSWPASELYILWRLIYNNVLSYDGLKNITRR